MQKHLRMSSIIERLIGASFSISIFYFINYMSSEFNLYEFHQTVTIPEIWIVFFGYGILSSFIIDLIGKFLPSYDISKQILLYILFGYLIFFFFMPFDFALLAGTVGALFSLLFLFGKAMLKPRRWYSWLVFVIPLTCIAIMPFDHTSKVGWHEVAGDSSVSVTYDYFYGEHLIPIHGLPGEKLYFEIKHQISDEVSYGYGFTVYNEDGDYAGMNDEGEDVISVEFEEESTKYIAVSVSGGKHSGFQVKWWNEHWLAVADV